MNRCLSDQSLLECYAGDGDAGDLIHLEDCLSCAARYKALQGDMALIAPSLATAPPAIRRQPFLPWRVAVSGAAVAVAFTIGWSLRGFSTAPVGPHPAHIASKSTANPIQLSAADMGQLRGPASAIYAAYVQDAFSGDPCSEGNDPLEPGCL